MSTRAHAEDTRLPESREMGRASVHVSDSFFAEAQGSGLLRCVHPDIESHGHGDQQLKRVPGPEAMRGKRQNTALLVIVDKSAAARRAVEYVAKMVGRRRGFRLRLAHVLAPVPPKLLEYRSVDHLDEQERVDARFEARQRQWLAAATAAAERTQAIAYTTLRKAGVPSKAVSTLFSDPLDSHDAAEQILELARTHQCRTIVVGRQSISWFRKLMHGDLAAELVRRGEDLTIWVVE